MNLPSYESVQIFLLFLGLILVVSLFHFLMQSKKKYPDPLKMCQLYKDKGCAHVDGFLCHPATCTDRVHYVVMLMQQKPSC